MRKLFPLLCTLSVSCFALPGCDSADFVDETEQEMAAARSCEVHEDIRSCGDQEKGVQYCDYVGPDWEEGPLEWGPCLAPEMRECDLGDTQSCGFEPEDGFGDLNASCELYDGVPEYDPEACNTPLVMSFDRAAISFQASSAAFDISGECSNTDWPSAATPWLALDIDHSGSIDGGHELFGSGTILPSGSRAKNGFLALATLDVNADGRVDRRDPRFAELVLWTDADGDKVSTLAELTPAIDAGLVGIDVHYTIGGQCDERGNCDRERASFQYRSVDGVMHTGDVVDVHLACQ